MSGEGAARRRRVRGGGAGDLPDRGAVSTEYALLAAFIAAVVALAVFALHNVVARLFSLGFAAFS